MSILPDPRPSGAAPSRPASASPRATRALGAAAFCLAFLAGCIAAPDPSAAAAGEGPALSDPAARSNTDTETRKIPSCIRVWSDALADSVWNCPDPKPPAPAQGRQD